MHTPQILVIVLYAIALLLNANAHGKPQPNTNFWKSLISLSMMTGLLIWGGFFG